MNSGTNISTRTSFISQEGSYISDNGTTVEIKTNTGISPKLYFKYIKKKFGLLGGRKIERRIKKLEKLIYELLDNGQESMGEVFFKKVIQQIRESEMYAYGYKIFIEEKHLNKFKYSVKNVSISETPLKNYIKIIPTNVLQKIKDTKAKKIFDEIVIIHYDENGTSVKKTEKEEREDPIVFGKIEESSRYYFIDDWEDKDCDLTLDDIVDKLSLEDREITINKNPIIK